MTAFEQAGRRQSNASRRCNGFTFVELLVALAIMVSAFAIIFSLFTTTLKAWDRGSDALSKLHHGDFVMEQLVQSLRSAAFFDSVPEFYEFRLEKGFAGGNPADEISWVTSSAAFMPLDSPYANGLHRLVVKVDRAGYGEYGVSVNAFPHLMEEEDFNDDAWMVSTKVRGLRCRIYDDELSTWEDGWDESNAVPSLVEITLYLEPEEEFGPPIRMQRAVEIPIAPAITGRVEFVEEEP